MLQCNHRIADLLFAHRVEDPASELAFLGKHLDLLQAHAFGRLVHGEGQFGAVIAEQVLHQGSLQQGLQGRVIIGSEL